MKHNNIEKLEKEVLKKYHKKDKQKPKMKVSGKSVLKLQRIIGCK